MTMTLTADYGAVEFERFRRDMEARRKVTDVAAQASERKSNAAQMRRSEVVCGGGFPSMTPEQRPPGNGSPLINNG